MQCCNRANYPTFHRRLRKTRAHKQTTSWRGRYNLVTRKRQPRRLLQQTFPNQPPQTQATHIHTAKTIHQLHDQHQTARVCYYVGRYAAISTTHITQSFQSDGTGPEHIQFRYSANNCWHCTLDTSNIIQINKNNFYKVQLLT